MLLAGDEVRRTQYGNNNAYCQDNEISWLNWHLAEKHQEMFRFFTQMIAFRQTHACLHSGHFLSGALNARGLPDVTWHGCQLYSPGWNDANSGVLACTLGGVADDPDLHVMLNMEMADLDFALPPVAGRQWYRVVDTALASPADIVEPGNEPRVATPIYRVQSHSVVVLIAKA
jgi:glycogen operon protein